MENQSIEILTNNTTEDYRRALMNFNKRKIIFLGTATAFFTIFVGLGITTILLSKKNNIPFAFFIPALIPVFICAFSLFLLIWAIVKNSKVIGENTEATKFIFNEQGMETASASTSVKTLWSKFYKILETQTDFLIFTQKNIVIPIPKRFFTDENQVSNFRNMISAKLGAKAKLKS